jgi:hypothetical protein
MNMERIYFIMKNFIFISAYSFSMMINAQAHLDSKAQDIYDEFVLDRIKFINDLFSFIFINEINHLIYFRWNNIH